MWQKSPAGTRQTEGKNLVWFGEIERKLAKLSITTFTYNHSSSSLFNAILSLIFFSLCDRRAGEEPKKTTAKKRRPLLEYFL
jgi:hypothetical protein